LTSLVERTEDEQRIWDEAREVSLRLEPIAAKADGSSSLDSKVLDELRRSGLFSLAVPRQYGGRYQSVDPVAICLVREALMATCSMADALFALQGIGSFAIARAGSQEQKATWLPRVAQGEILAALALTEQEAGSDLKAITTSAVEHDGSITITGRKSFISNAGIAGFFTLLAREGDGFSTFLVPADAPGLSTTPSPELAAPHLIGEVVLDDVVLSAEARLGAAGTGLEHVLATLAMFRVSVGAAAVGLAQRALEEAARHARERKQFGRSLAELGPVASLLADSWADVASARVLTYQVARLARRDPLEHLAHSSLAKLHATEACGRVTDRCVQVMGRWGLIRDSRIERCFRQARPMRVYEGASEVLRVSIARQLVEEVI
jgi:acyl-CoA dehydrogenase